MLNVQRYRAGDIIIIIIIIIIMKRITNNYPTLYLNTVYLSGPWVLRHEYYKFTFHSTLQHFSKDSKTHRGSLLWQATTANSLISLVMGVSNGNWGYWTILRILLFKWHLLPPILSVQKNFFIHNTYKAELKNILF